MRRLLVFTAVVGSLALAGCASVKNVRKPEPKLFGGAAMSYGDFVRVGDEAPGLGAGMALPALGPLWLCDKPLSLAADCATLPYVLWKRMEYRRPQLDPNPPGLREALAREPSGVGPMPALPAPGFRGKPSDVVGNSVAKATEIAQSQGYPFVVVGSVDGVTPTIAHAGRRIEARTKDGVVISAQVFEQ